jgi:hypothetical protein
LLELPPRVPAAAFVGLLFGSIPGECALLHPPMYRCSWKWACNGVPVEPANCECVCAG